MTTIEVWSPKYKTNQALLAKYKVMPGENRVIFTKAKHLSGHVYRMNGEDIVKYPIVDNGKIACYAVDMNNLERIA